MSADSCIYSLPTQRYERFGFVRTLPVFPLRWQPCCFCPRGHRSGRSEGALGLLRALTLSEPQEAVDLTAATAEALVATAQAEPEERGRAALEAYRAAEATYLVVADQIRKTPLEREHVAGLRALLDARDRELDEELNEQRLKDQSAGGVSVSVRVGKRITFEGNARRTCSRSTAAQGWCVRAALRPVG